ncbi:MAG: ABC transporter ATP-binding protein [Pseudobutyrivibrio sp.]|nr:ABC transporter ATP-binding protein [Pseudobutyrivibrio sp.]
MGSMETRGLSVGYEKIVVDDFTVDIKEGQILALIGPNGAGKSTVLKTITGQIKKIGGKIYIGDEEESRISPQEMARRLSMVTTERIHPNIMTCRELVATGRYPYTGILGILSEHDNKKVDEAIELVNGLSIADMDFSKISDGQRQRIMLARAICQEPDFLILDEPTSFLDLQYKIDILSIIKRLARENKVAVIMSIHELEFVPAIADAVVAIEGTKVRAYGKPEDIITGDNIESLYHMKKGMGKVAASGLWDYAKSLRTLLD